MYQRAAAWAVRQVTRHWWIPQSFRERIARLTFRPHKPRNIPFRIRHRNVYFRGNLNEYLDWRVYFLGDFERETINLCRELANNAKWLTFVDVGANNGLFTLSLAGHFNAIVAFEPFIDNVRLFEAALLENKIKNVEIHPCGLGNSDTLAALNLPPADNKGIGSFLPLQDAAHSVVVPIRRGDDILKQYIIGVIKIDVEGYEAFVLEGLRNLLSRDRPFIILEISNASKKPIESSGGLLKLLPRDYDVYEISDHSTCRQFHLRMVKDREVLGRQITNNLCCPSELSGELKCVKNY